MEYLKLERRLPKNSVHEAAYVDLPRVLLAPYYYGHELRACFLSSLPHWVTEAVSPPWL